MNGITWETVDRLARDGDLDGIVTVLRAATAADRVTVGERAETAILTAGPDTWWPTAIGGTGRAQVNPAPGYAIAVVGCVRSAAKAATLLGKLSARTSNHSYLVRVREAAGLREPSWLGDVGTRLARRLPTRDPRSEDWSLAATVLLAASAEPPATEAFVRGWIRQLSRPGLPGSESVPLASRLATDPFLDRLLPAFFEIDGLGRDAAADFWDPDTGRWERAPWFPAVIPRLVADGRLDRAGVLDATVGRLERGGRPAALRPFVLLHNALAPAVDEVAAHRPGYTRMLSAGPSTVAGMAQRALRALDDAGRLDLSVLLETSEVTLARPEKILVKAQLSWLSKVAARTPERVSEILPSLAAAFGNPSSEIQQRALDLVARLHRSITPRPGTDRSTASPPDLAGPNRPSPSQWSEERLAAAVDLLSGDLAEQAAALLGFPEPGRVPIHQPGGLATVAERPAVVVARSMPAAVAHPVKLASEVTSLLVTETAVRWERVLAGLVALTASGRGPELAVLLAPLLEREPWLFEEQLWAAQRRTVFLGVMIRRLRDPDDPGPVWKRMVAAVHHAWETGQRGGPDSALAATPEGVLAARIAEAALMFVESPVPMLLATPTHVNGTVEAAVLLERITRFEAEGREPWPLDLEQALLRLPRRVDDAVVRQAALLTSPAGRSFSAWLAGGGLPDPVTVRIVQETAPATGITFDNVVGMSLRQPAPAEPSTSQDASASEPASTEPASEPASTEPASEPASTEPASTDPASGPAHGNPASGPASDGGHRKRRVLADMRPNGTGGLRMAAQLFELTHPRVLMWLRSGPGRDGDVLAMVLPHHREAVAAWALPDLAGLAEPDARGAGSGHLLPLLADGDGPPGPATAIALAYGLSARHETDRVAAVDAFLALTSRHRQGAADEIPAPPAVAGAVGTEVGRLCEPEGPVKVSRVTAALTAAHRAGATVAVWEVLEAALSLLLPKAPRGLPDLLALATEVAHVTGARGEIAGLAAVAKRRGSARLAVEARRLHTLLTTP
ncbi:DUF7824 domain-containing protein [Actinoplanes subglobosus]|uniref:DUF6493 family protein n=1 Tax=Actinoplanes subglobosus TaxID=1547892 RepID=A0ABV8J5L3_9ACTN